MRSRSACTRAAASLSISWAIRSWRWRRPHPTATGRARNATSPTNSCGNGSVAFSDAPAAAVAVTSIRITPSLTPRVVPRAAEYSATSAAMSIGPTSSEPAATNRIRAATTMAATSTGRVLRARRTDEPATTALSGQPKDEPTKAALSELVTTITIPQVAATAASSTSMTAGRARTRLIIVTAGLLSLAGLGQGCRTSAFLVSLGLPPAADTHLRAPSSPLPGPNASAPGSIRAPVGYSLGGTSRLLAGDAGAAVDLHS